jgi:hypothetical protein
VRFLNIYYPNILYLCALLDTRTCTCTGDYSEAESTAGLTTTRALKQHFASPVHPLHPPPYPFTTSSYLICLRVLNL